MAVGFGFISGWWEMRGSRGMAVGFGFISGWWEIAIFYLKAVQKIQTLDFN
jgi:hypothetical protein